MHFSFHEATKAQLPDYIPIQSTIVIITGMFEVATGILILVPKARKWAAMLSLILLFLFIPAVYHILAEDSAFLGPPDALRVIFRLLLVPNNIFLALCSIHLWSNPGIPSVGPAQIIEETFQPSTKITRGRSTLLVAVLMLASNCAGFIPIWSTTLQNYAIPNLWAMMCIATGAFVGFLFAVPRVNPNLVQNSALLTNPNIEIVSDWLTKILVGVGLIHLKDIGEFINDRSQELAIAIGPPSAEVVKLYAPFATALIVYFFVVGLIQGYLLTRMFLSWEFEMQMRMQIPEKE